VGDVILPAGACTFALPSTSFPYTLCIHGKTVDAIVTAVTIDEAAVSHGARLDLMEVAAGPALQKFEAPELGLTFIYWTPKQKRLRSREARRKSVPQGASASQVTENNTFVEVHTGSLRKSHACYCKCKIQKLGSCFSIEANSHSGEAVQLQARYTPQHGMQCA
jgi:hypothetical protein